MHKCSLKWKKKTCQELDSKWIESTINPLGWTYFIDESHIDGKYVCCLSLSEELCDEVRLTTESFSTIKKAKQFCENHLLATYKKIKKNFDK